jgi:outer membrane lipoprotein-sorting protein
MYPLRLLIPMIFLAAQAFADVAIDMAANHCEALGGTARITEISALRAAGVTRIGNKTLEIGILAQKPNRVRTEILADGRKIIMAYDGANPPWECDTKQQPRKESPMADSASREFIVDSEFLDPLVTMDSRGFTVRSLGIADWEGGRYQCLLAMRSGEEPVELWLDSSTYLISRQFRTRKLPDGRETKIETRFSDFRPVMGVLMPYRITVYAEGRRLHETVIEVIEPNPNITENIFRTP